MSVLNQSACRQFTDESFCVDEVSTLKKEMENVFPNIAQRNMNAFISCHTDLKIFYKACSPAMNECLLTPLESPIRMSSSLLA